MLAAYFLTPLVLDSEVVLPCSILSTVVLIAISTLIFYKTYARVCTYTPCTHSFNSLEIHVISLYNSYHLLIDSISKNIYYTAWLFIKAFGDCLINFVSTQFLPFHEIKRHLLLGRKVMTNLDSILKSRDTT